MDNLLDRITINPEICHGKPIIRNKRYPVSMILDLLSSGESYEDILSEYPTLQINDIYACLAYASQIADVKTRNSAA